MIYAASIKDLWLKFAQFVVPLLLLAMSTSWAGAGETSQAILPEEMRQSCREAHNGCQVCVILAPSRVVHCSLPGIACQPTPWSCRVPVTTTAEPDRDVKR